MLNGILVDAFGDLHVEGAVLGDFAEWGEVTRFFVFLPPAEGIEAVCRFSGAEGCRGHGIEFQAETYDFFQLEHHVEIERLLAERVENIRLQDRVVELQVIPSDDEIGPDEFLAELFHLAFLVDLVGSASGAVGHRDGDLHLVLVREAADVAEAALRFEVEVDDVFLSHGIWIGSGCEPVEGLSGDRLAA